MTKYEKYKDIPHFNLIKQDELVHLPSIFMFTTNTELYPFLMACSAYNCTIIFDNEQLTIPPQYDEVKSLEIMCYTVIMCNRKIGDDYIRYLSNLSKMQWVKGVHEPILKGENE